MACACSSELAAQAEQAQSLEADAPLRLFSGPRDLTATAAKYMCSFREAEETDVSVKRARMVHSGSHVSNFFLNSCLQLSRVSLPHRSYCSGSTCLLLRPKMSVCPGINACTAQRSSCCACIPQYRGLVCPKTPSDILN